MEVGHDKEEELQQDGMVLEDVTATGDEENDRDESKRRKFQYYFY